MTVKDVFELRKLGRIEEAYQAIVPMYKVHHGHYTTICMFFMVEPSLRAIKLTCLLPRRLRTQPRTLIGLLNALL